MGRKTTEAEKRASKKLYNKRIAAGICPNHAKSEAVPGKRVCLKCIEDAKKSSATRYSKLKNSGICATCSSGRLARPGKVSCQVCYDQWLNRMDKKKKERVCIGCTSKALSNRVHCLECSKKDWLRKQKENGGDLDDSQLLALIEQPCHYCGGYSDRGFNGIDQRVAGLGYTKLNSLPCCWPCNQAKHRLSYETFISLCIKVSKKHGGSIESKN
jgi:hypothetical protein